MVVNPRDYLSRLPSNSEQMPLRQATTTTPMVRITTVRLKAFIFGESAGWGSGLQFKVGGSR